MIMIITCIIYDIGSTDPEG